VELYFRLYIQTGNYSLVSWWSSISGYTYPQGSTPGYPGAALFQAIHPHRNYSQVSWCSSISSYTYTQAPTPGYSVAVLFQAIPTYTQEPSLGYPGAALFQAIHTYKNLLLSILVPLYFKLYIRTGTYSQVSWCRSTLRNI